MSKTENDKKPVIQNSLEVVIQTKDLKNILESATSIIEKKNVVLAHNNVKLVAKDSKLAISATDLDLYLNQTMGTEVIKEGQSAVSTQVLSDIVRKISDEEITLKQDLGSEHLQVICNSCKFDLLTHPANEFPEMEDLEERNSLNVGSTELARIIGYTSFAMSKEETRYNLNGLYLHIKNGELASAATDAHRFAIAASSTNSNADDFGVIIPRKTAEELLKIIKNVKNIHSDISITLNTNKVKFAFNNVVLISKLVDGNFPDYESFIPENNQSKLVINTKLLSDAIDRVATVTVDKFKAIKLVFNDSCLTITASGEAKGNGSEVIYFSDDPDKYCNFSGKDVTIGFNPKYIMDVLSVLKENQVHLYLNDASSPVLIKTLENPKDNFVIMPVKV